MTIFSASAPQTITVTVLPASTKAGKETIRALLASGSNVKINAVYRDPSKAPPEFLSHSSYFTAVKGDVADPSTLDFVGSDVLFYIPPPTYDGIDTGEWAVLTANNVKTALANTAAAAAAAAAASRGKGDDSANVKRLVLFSSIGAQHDKGIGILRLNHVTDVILGGLAIANDNSDKSENGEGVVVEDVVIIRPGYFMEGFGSWVEEAVATGTVHAWLTPLDHRAPIVSLGDIASTCATEILKPFHLAPTTTTTTTTTTVGDKAKTPQPSPRYIKIFGPRHYSSLDLQHAISRVINENNNNNNKEKEKVVVNLEPVPPHQLADYFSQVIPPHYVQEFVDLTTAVLPGGIMVEAGDFAYDDDDDETDKNDDDDDDDDDSTDTKTVRGKVELVDAIRGVYENMMASKEEKEKDKDQAAN